MPRAAAALDPAAEIARIAGAVPCARLAARLDPREGLLQLAGHVPTRQAALDLAAAVARVAGVEAVADDALSVLGEPYCEAVALLARIDALRFGEDVVSQARATAVRAPVAREFAGGTLLELVFETPAFESHVSVDYFDPAGQVIHLYQGAGADRTLPPDTRLRIGGEDGAGLTVTVVPPFGTNLVVALASSVPLFTRPRPHQEPAAAYLKAVAERIDTLAARGASVEAMPFVVTTVPADRATAAAD